MESLTAKQKAAEDETFPVGDEVVSQEGIRASVDVDDAVTSSESVMSEVQTGPREGKVKTDNPAVPDVTACLFS